MDLQTGATGRHTLCRYELDASLRLVGVDAAWSAFAAENGAPALQPPGCLGRSIAESIADTATLHIYRQVFDRVRRTGAPMRFGIRCDGPALRRWLELEIRPRGAGFEVESVLVRAEAREPQALLAAPRPDDGTMLSMCSWCKRVSVDQRWLEVEAAVRALGLFEREVLPAITHGICDACFGEMDAILR